MTTFNETPSSSVHEGVLFVQVTDDDAVFVVSRGLDDAGYVTVGSDGVRVYSDAANYELIAVLRPNLEDGQFVGGEQREGALLEAARALNAAISLHGDTEVDSDLADLEAPIAEFPADT